MSVRHKIRSQIDLLAELRRLNEMVMAKLNDLDTAFDVRLTASTEHNHTEGPWIAEPTVQKVKKKRRKVVAAALPEAKPVKRKYTKRSKWWGKKKKK